MKTKFVKETDRKGTYIIEGSFVKFKNKKPKKKRKS